MKRFDVKNYAAIKNACARTRMDIGLQADDFHVFVDKS